MTPSLLVSPASSVRFPLNLLKKPGKSFAWVFCAVLTGWSVRLIVVAFVYQGFLDPARGHWEFAYEIGRVARSIALGQGFSNPYWANTGPTALLTPVYPYFLAGIFTIFGVYTKASALVFLGINTFFSAVTSVPIFLLARRTLDLRTAKVAAWVWAFFPYAIDLSATTMWYHSFVALLLAVIVLLVLSLGSSDRLSAWAGLGVLLGFAALTNPVIIGIVPFAGSWLWAQLKRKRKRAWRATTVGLLAMMVTVLPWFLRNERALHQPVVFKDGFWLEVCVGNVNNSLHWWDGNEHPSGSARDNAQYEQSGEMNYMAAKRSRAIAYMATHPGAYALRSLRHAIFMWTGFWSFDCEYLRQEPFDPENICFLTSLSLLSMGGLYCMFRERRGIPARLYFLVLSSFPVPYYLSHLDPGFRHPIDPLLVILACFALTQLWVRLRVVSKTNAVLSIFTFALMATASGQTVPKNAETDNKLIKVTGVVTDQRGDPVPVATITLIEPAGENPPPVLTDENGSFSMAADESMFDLQVSAPGFATKTVHGDPGGNQQLDLGRLALTIQNATVEVRVSVTREELAKEQVRAEEKQRILGLIPNFFVTYDHNPVPLQAKQKYELAFRTLIDPETIGMDLFSSAIQQETGGLKAYGAGSQGYAKRFAASYGTGAIDTMLGSAVLPSLFKQDPRYFYKGAGTIRQRALYAMSMSVICKGDNGHRQFNYSGFLGGLAAGGISNLYYPPANRNALGMTFENTAIGIGSSAMTNLLQEFLIRRFTRNAKQ